MKTMLYEDMATAILNHVDKQKFIDLVCAKWGLGEDEKERLQNSQSSLFEILNEMSEGDIIDINNFFLDYFSFTPCYVPIYKEALKDMVLYAKSPDDDCLGRVKNAIFNNDGKDIVADNTMVSVLCYDSNEYINVPMTSLYIRTDKKCPICKNDLYMSDVLGYDYVCLDCDENFDDCEL